MATAIQEGRYIGRAKKAKWGTSKEKGTLGVEILFEVDVTQFEKANRFAIIWFSNKNGPPTKSAEQAAMCGIPADSYKKQGTNQFDVNGPDVALIFGNESYKDSQGNTKTALKIKYINSVDGKGPVKSQFEETDVKAMQMKAEELDITNLMKAAQYEQAAQKGQPQGQVKSSSAEPSFNADEEVPF